MKKLTRLAIENIFHPFQTFFIIKISHQRLLHDGYSFGFCGENEAEYGNPIADNNSSLRSKSIFSSKNMDTFSRFKYQRTKRVTWFTKSRFKLIHALLFDVINNSKIEVHYLGYYLRWIPQEVYYYAVENRV